MFKRVHWELGADWIPQVAFVIFFAIFITVVIRAIRMSKSEADKMVNLPLDQERLVDGKENV